MSYQPLTVIPVTQGEIPAAVDLLMAQEARQFAQDSRLRAVRPRHRIATLLASQEKREIAPLVARDEDGRVRGYAQPAIWSLKENSLLQAFLTAHNGIVRQLTFPNPGDEDAPAVVTALLTALTERWQRHGTLADLLHWPSSDAWVEPLFAAQGFQRDSICALRPLQPFFTARSMASHVNIIRPAQPEDEAALVRLFEAELRFHERYTPFVHSSIQALQAFRSKLGHLWAGESLQAGAPHVLVVEHDQEIVAMAENTLLELGPDDEPGFTPAGHYWCIDNVSVHEGVQGRGIGRLLVQAIEDARLSLQLDLDGYILWYNPDNPKAAQFWSRLGFQPLWTTYQRSAPPSEKQSGRQDALR